MDSWGSFSSTCAGHGMDTDCCQAGVISSANLACRLSEVQHRMVRCYIELIGTGLRLACVTAQNHCMPHTHTPRPSPSHLGQEAELVVVQDCSGEACEGGQLLGQDSQLVVGQLQLQGKGVRVTGAQVGEASLDQINRC
jgi:hypothetical protein